MKDLLESLASLPSLPEPNYNWVIHDLEQDFPGLKINRIYGFYPTQAEGSYLGKEIYVRYRWDTFSITMGDSQPKGLPKMEYYFESDDDELLRDSDGGFLEPEVFYKIFSKGFSTLLSQSK